MEKQITRFRMVAYKTHRTVFWLLFIIYGNLLAQVHHLDIDAVNDSISYDYIVSHPYASVAVLMENVHRAQKANYRYGEAKALSLLGLAYYFQGKYDASTECYTQALKIFDELEKYEDLSSTYGEFGYQLKRRDLSKAEQYMRMAIHLALSRNVSEELLCKLYDNYGVLKEMRAQYDSASFYYLRALRMKEKRNDTYGIPYSLNKLAGLNLLRGKHNEAREYLQRSDDYRRREAGNYGRAENFSLWGDFYSEIGKTDSAIYSYKQALLLAEQYEYAFLMEYCYKKLSEMYARKNDYRRALEYFQRYNALKDSTQNIQTRKTIAELEIAYETAHKDKLLAAKEFEIRQQRFWIVLGSIGVIILGLVVVMRYQYQRKKHIQEKREIELKAKLREAELAESLANEKVRISRELHDNIGARMTFIINALETLMFKGYEEIRANIQDLAHFSRETLEEVRNTIWAIKSKEGTVEDLLLHIRKYVQRIQSHLDTITLTIEEQCQVERTLSSLQMLNLFRIVQEALQNALKHSKGTAVRIVIECTTKELSIKVIDNGKGFSSETLQRGNGMYNMQARCEEIGAHVAVETSSSGTTVCCTLPK